GIAAVRTIPSRRDEHLDPSGRVPGSCAADSCEVLELLLLVGLVEGCALERPEPRADPDRGESVDDSFRLGRVDGVGRDLRRIDALRVPCFREKLLRARLIERIGGGRPEELATTRGDAGGRVAGA